jgi:signal transduction histidine kinase
MIGAKKIKLQWIKGLMLFCQVLLLVFAAQWLMSQYNDQQEQLKKNLTKIFTDVQSHIEDSLYLSKADPYAVKPPSDKSSKKVTLSPQGLHRILAGARPLTDAENTEFFNIDTIRFNEQFISLMRHNGWNFHSEWVSSIDSDSKGNKAIFIPSSYFTDGNGIIVSNISPYLVMKMWPQLCFVLILLVLTGGAFLITYRSLDAQIKLGLLKDDFISNMSHELKTPIATVKVALEALNNFNAIDDKKLSREYLGMASSEMDRLELLATHVLNTSLLESGKLYLQRESYDLKKLVNEVLQVMQLKLAQHDAKISFEATGAGFVIPMDKLHTQGVLVNLIDNSLKYGVSPVRIHINLAENNGAVQLKISDNGPGIPEEYKEKVFEKFFRVPTGNRHNTKGYGLGLSYAAQVMRQHNGSINVNNMAGGGCVFTLTMPLSPHP